MYPNVSDWGQDIGLPILSGSFCLEGYGGNQSYWPVFTVIKVTFLVLGEKHFEWSNSGFQLQSSQKSCSVHLFHSRWVVHVVLWPDSANELFICNSHLCYHYCSEFSLDGLGSLFVIWSTVSSSSWSEWWEQWGAWCVHGYHPHWLQFMWAALAPPQCFLAPPWPSPWQRCCILAQAWWAAAPWLFLAMGLFWHSW